VELLQPYQEILIGRPGLSLWIHGARDRCAAAHRMPAYWYASIGVRRTFDASGRITAVDAMAMGPTLTPYAYCPAPRTELIGLAVQPEFAPRLIDRRVGDVGREHVWAQPHPVLREAVRLAERNAPAARIAEALGRSALAQLSKTPQRELRLRTALRIMRGSAGRTRIGAVAARVDLSERQLRRALQSTIGLAPKLYARLIRFNALLACADRQEQPNWADLAAQSGYSDQAHMIREAGALAGTAPSRLHSERRAEADFFNQPA
jgi:AraC-like DNA-binding protein